MNSLLSKLRSRLRILGTYFGIALVSLIISYLLFLEFDEDEWVSANYADYIDELVFNGAPVAGCLLYCLCFFGFVIIPGVSVVLAHEEWVELKVDEKKEREEKQRREEKLLLKEEEEIVERVGEWFKEEFGLSDQEWQLYNSEFKDSELKKLTKKLGYDMEGEDGFDEFFRLDMVKKLLRTKKRDLMIIGEEYRVMGRKTMLKVDLIIGILQALPFGTSTSGITKRLQAGAAVRKRRREEEEKAEKERQRKLRAAKRSRRETCLRCGVRSSSRYSVRNWKGVKVCSKCDLQMQDDV